MTITTKDLSEAGRRVFEGYLALGDPHGLRLGSKTERSRAEERALRMVESDVHNGDRRLLVGHEPAPPGPQEGSGLREALQAAGLPLTPRAVEAAMADHQELVAFGLTSLEATQSAVRLARKRAGIKGGTR